MSIKLPPWQIKQNFRSSIANIFNQLLDVVCLNKTSYSEYEVIDYHVPNWLTNNSLDIPFSQISESIKVSTLLISGQHLGTYGDQIPLDVFLSNTTSKIVDLDNKKLLMEFVSARDKFVKEIKEAINDSQPEQVARKPLTDNQQQTPQPKEEKSKMYDTKTELTKAELKTVTKTARTKGVGGKEQAKSLGKLVGNAAAMAATDQVGEVFLKMSETVLGNNPNYKHLMATSEGREAVKLLIAVALRTVLLTSPEIVAGSDGIVSVCDLQITYSTAKLMSVFLSTMGEQLTVLAKLGASIASTALADQ